MWYNLCDGSALCFALGGVVSKNVRRSKDVSSERIGSVLGCLRWKIGVPEGVLPTRAAVQNFVISKSTLFTVNILPRGVLACEIHRKTSQVRINNTRAYRVLTVRRSSIQRVAIISWTIGVIATGYSGSLWYRL